MSNDKKRKYISSEEHFQIARELERHHAIFERIWSMGRIRFTEKVPTAGVMFNKKGECLDFFVNPDFWESLSFKQKCFVISHECMHISLNHGYRSRQNVTNGMQNMIVNIAQDLVINHHLINRYGYDRDEIDPKTEQAPERVYCWVEKFFPDGDVPADKNFEFYYNKLNEIAQDKLQEMMENSELVDEHGMGQGQGQGQDGKDQGEGDGEGDPELQDKLDNLDKDDFNYFDSDEYTDDFSDVIDKLNDELEDYEKETLQNFVEGNEDSDKAPENPDYGPTGISNGVPSKDQGDEKGGQEAGTTAGTGWTFARKIKEPRKHKFEHIITSWARKRITPEYLEVDQWVHRNRRFSGIDTGLMLPTEYETMEKKRVDDKIEVWFYQDTSGSCSGYTDRFFYIAECMPLDRFNMRMFCFDTKVYETNLEDRKLYGFGGTYFHILEKHIQEEREKNPKLKYPDAVFVVTDGYGSDIVPEKPKQWHWIMTPGHSRNNIPDNCNFYNLEDYE